MGEWLLKSQPPERNFLTDYEQLCLHIKPADVLIVEGQSRASRIIKRITQSPWSHAALYIGRKTEINDPELLKLLETHYTGSEKAQLLIESEIGRGTVITPLSAYNDYHIRILRPTWLEQSDVHKVIAYTFSRLGGNYDVRHLLDLARFLFPWGFYPRRWRSSLFQHNALKPTEDICSSMIADAFQSVKYPILPLIKKGDIHHLELIKRNPRLFTPSDFDYSPFFNIIKYPIFNLSEKKGYANLPWVTGKFDDN